MTSTAKTRKKKITDAKIVMIIQKTSTIHLKMTIKMTMMMMTRKKMMMKMRKI